MTSTEIENSTPIEPVKTEPELTKMPDARSSEFRVIVAEMTRGEAAASSKAGLRERKCVVYSLSAIPNIMVGAGYRVKYGVTYLVGNQPSTPTIDCATVFQVGVMISLKNEIPDDALVLILDEEILAKEPARRRFNMEDFLNKALIDLARVAPKNKTVQAHFQSMFGKPVPDTVSNYHELKDWVEFSFDPPPQSSATAASASQAQQLGRAAARTFGVQVTLEEDEIGNCTYRQSRRVQFPVSIALSVIGEIVDSEDRSLEDMVEQIKERALEEAAESDPGGGELGETDYFDMETSSTEDTETSVNKQQIERSLREYIRTNYGPQEAEEIFNR